MTAPVTGPSVADGGRRSRRRLPRPGLRTRRVLAVGFWLVVAVFTAGLVRETLRGLDGTAAASTGWGVAALWLLVLTVARASDVVGWYELLRGAGVRGRLLPAARVYTVAELVRYLPGGVLHFAARYRFATRMGVSPQAVVATTAADLALRLGCGVALFVLTVPFWPGLPTPYVVGSLAALPLLLVAVAPPVLGPALRFAARKLGSTGEVPALGYGCLLRSGAVYLAGWLVRGVVTWLMARELLGVGADVAAVMVGATAIAWVVGVVVPFAPGGLGVREAVGVALLVPYVPAAQALMLMLLTRLAMMAAEAVAVAVVVVADRLRRNGPGPTTDDDVPADRPVLTPGGSL